MHFNALQFRCLIKIHFIPNQVFPTRAVLGRKQTGKYKNQVSGRLLLSDRIELNCRGEFNWIFTNLGVRLIYYYRMEGCGRFYQILRIPDWLQGIVPQNLPVSSLSHTGPGKGVMGCKVLVVYELSLRLALELILVVKGASGSVVLGIIPNTTEVLVLEAEYGLGSYLFCWTGHGILTIYLGYSISYLRGEWFEVLEIVGVGE